MPGLQLSSFFLIDIPSNSTVTLSVTVLTGLEAAQMRKLIPKHFKNAAAIMRFATHKQSLGVLCTLTICSSCQERTIWPKLNVTEISS